MIRPPPRSPLFPSTPLFRSRDARREYDKVVSIGTLEHAGRDQLAQVVQAHARFLKPGGLGMLHFIGHVGRFETDVADEMQHAEDRKSTRLNSSHPVISYAGF